MIVAKGTGINVYVVIREQMNTSFTLDRGLSSAFVYSWDARCLEYQYDVGGPTGCYNTSVYNAQSLNYGTHTLKIALFSYLGPNSYEGDLDSLFWFDYAVISTPTSSSGHLMSSSQPPQYVSLPPCGGGLLTFNSNKLPVAIGGAVGGVAAVMAVVLAALYYRKRGYRHQRHPTEVDPEPIESSFRPNTFSTFSTNPPLNRDPLRDWSPTSLLPEDTDLQSRKISPSLIPQKYGIQSATAHFPASSVADTSATRYTLSSKSSQSAEVETIAHTLINPSRVVPVGKMSTHLTEDQSGLVLGLPTSVLAGDVNLPIDDVVPPPLPSKPGICSEATVAAHVPRSSVAATRTSQYSSSNEPRPPTEVETDSRASAIPSTVMPMATGSPVSARLTEEQSELVQGLIRHNVPLPTVVGAIEGMLRREGPSGSGEGTCSRLTQSNMRPETDNPPDYDFV
jgi:hypothetical protein